MAHWRLGGNTNRLHFYVKTHICNIRYAGVCNILAKDILATNILVKGHFDNMTFW